MALQLPVSSLLLFTVALLSTVRRISFQLLEIDYLLFHLCEYVIIGVGRKYIVRHLEVCS